MAERKFRTTSEAEIRKRVETGASFVQIAADLNVSLPSLRQAYSLLGIKRVFNSSLPPHADRIALWADRISCGDTAADIARDNGITRQAVYETLKRAGLPRSPSEYLKAAVAQKAEQLPCSETAAGSTPAGGTILRAA